jgi:hypothetical protein
MDCNKSSVLFESNYALSGGVNGALGGLTWGFAFLKEKGLGKSNGSPKREVVFAFGNSSTCGITGTMGDGDEYARRVSSVSGGWGLFICRLPWLDKISSSLILPCSDETRDGVNTLPCSDKTTGLARILPCSNETCGLDRGGEFDAGGTGMSSPGLRSNFLPRVLLDDWGGNTHETLGSGFKMGTGLVLDLVLAAGGGLDSDANSSGDDDASESASFVIIPDLVVIFTWRHTGKFVGNGSAM